MMSSSICNLSCYILLILVITDTAKFKANANTSIGIRASLLNGMPTCSITLSTEESYLNETLY